MKSIYLFYLLFQDFQNQQHENVKKLHKVSIYFYYRSRLEITLTKQTSNGQNRVTYTSFFSSFSVDIETKKTKCKI